MFKIGQKVAYNNKGMSIPQGTVGIVIKEPDTHGVWVQYPKKKWWSCFQSLSVVKDKQLFLQFPKGHV